jgi:hypothetical protein
MSRAHLVYGTHAGGAIGAAGDDTPVAGYYRARLGGGRIPGAVRIWHGPPHDPDTGEEMDRSWRWQAEFNGTYIDIDRVWPICGRNPITRQQHDTILAQRAWAQQHVPDSAYANPRKRFDPLSATNPSLF